MPNHSSVTQRDRQLKKINAYARHEATKSNELSKKDLQNSDIPETQMIL